MASGSKTRAEILDKAKIPYEVVEHNVDEEEAKISYAHLNPEDIATKLAELKAIKPSYQYENSFVIGADQVLELNDTIINKAKDINEAKGQLLELQGKNHKLITSIAVAKNGLIVWKHRDTSNISMRELNEKQIDNYLSNHLNIRNCKINFKETGAIPLFRQKNIKRKVSLLLLRNVFFKEFRFTFIYFPEFLRLKTAVIVLNKISTSSRKFQFSMYSKSYLYQTSKSSVFLSFICNNPVIPGKTFSLRI